DLYVRARLRGRAYGGLVEAFTEAVERPAAELEELLVERLRALAQRVLDLPGLRLLRVRQVQLAREVFDHVAVRPVRPARPARPAVAFLPRERRGRERKRGGQRHGERYELRPLQSHLLHPLQSFLSVPSGADRDN